MWSGLFECYQKLVGLKVIGRGNRTKCNPQRCHKAVEWIHETLRQFEKKTPQNSQLSVVKYKMMITIIKKWLNLDFN